MGLPMWVAAVVGCFEFERNESWVVCANSIILLCGVTGNAKVFLVEEPFCVRAGSLCGFIKAPIRLTLVKPSLCVVMVCEVPALCGDLTIELGRKSTKLTLLT